MSLTQKAVGLEYSRALSIMWVSLCVEVFSTQPVLQVMVDSNGVSYS